MAKAAFVGNRRRQALPIVTGFERGQGLATSQTSNVWAS